MSIRQFYWRNSLRFGCPYCQWDNAEEESVTEHVRWRHSKMSESQVSNASTVEEVGTADLVIDEGGEDATIDIDEDELAGA